MRFHRNLHDWETETAVSFLDHIYSQVPRGEGNDRMPWYLKGSGKFDTRTYYQVIRGVNNFSFPWKDIWTAKIPRRVVFFLWTAAWTWILTLDNLMGMGLLLVNWCCICRRTRESVDHLLLHCDVTHALWGAVLQLFGISWVMPESIKCLLLC